MFFHSVSSDTKENTTTQSPSVRSDGEIEESSTINLNRFPEDQNDQNYSISSMTESQLKENHENSINSTLETIGNSSRPDYYDHAKPYNRTEQIMFPTDNTEIELQTHTPIFLELDKECEYGKL